MRNARAELHIEQQQRILNVVGDDDQEDGDERNDVTVERARLEQPAASA
ncbi:MAG: hypothetical protein IPK17_14070 [Chloroflexi bacterium]|nr:hypothetical protein [Chloroflexota bacterium]